MSFTNLFNPASSKPLTQVLASRRLGGTSTFFRDQLSISGWLELGACANTLLIMVAFPFIGRWALIMPFAALALRFGRTLLIAGGFLHNSLMDGVVVNKASAQMPNADGSFGPKPASKGVTVFLIGAKNNHSLGLLAPGFKDLGDYMDKMQQELNDRAEEFGLLGSSHWLESGRETGNEQLFLMYFRDTAGLHAYAHGELHREGWAWWNRTMAQHPHIAIWHEAYEAPAGAWESIYVNTRPTLLGATTYPVKTPQGTQWLNPLVDASRGVLKSSRGRMTRTDGDDNDKYDGATYTGHGSLEARDQ